MIRWFVVFWFSAEACSACREKKNNWGVPRIVVAAARLNFNTLYRVIGDLSSPRRRVNQTENDRRLSSSYKSHRPDLLAVDHAYPDVCPNFFVYFTGNPYTKPPLIDNLLRPLRAWKPRTPKTHKILLKLSYSARYVRHFICPPSSTR